MTTVDKLVQEIHRNTQTGRTHNYYKIKGSNFLKAANDADYEQHRQEDSVDVRVSVSDMLLNQTKIAYYLPENFMEDRSICKRVVRNNPQLLGVFNANVRDDEKVILECINGGPSKENAIYWSYVSPRLRQRKWLRDLAFNQCKYVFKYFTPKQKADDGIGTVAFMAHPELFSELSPKLQNYWKIVYYYIDQENKTLDDLDRMGYSKELISIIGKATTKEESIAKLYQYGLSRNSNPPKRNIRKI